MDEKTRAMVLEWIEEANGDLEAVARWMRDSLRMAGIKTCRALIEEARS